MPRNLQPSEHNIMPVDAILLMVRIMSPIVYDRQVMHNAATRQFVWCGYLCKSYRLTQTKENVNTLQSAALVRCPYNNVQSFV